MEGRTQRIDKNLSNQRGDFMKISYGYDRSKIKEIVSRCGSKNVKTTYSYLDVLNFYSKNKFFCAIIDDCCFFAGSFGKGHFRLVEMAVIEEQQKMGYGKAMMILMKQICRNKGAEKITLRTSKNEKAINFFKKQNAKVIGEIKNDYEMEIKL